MLAYKSEDVEEELNQAQKAIDVLGGKLLKTETRNLGEIVRKFVIIEKVKESPLSYPRGGNKTRLKPL